jgi:tetratricopeptide (TPR) repeat protein
MLRPLYTVLSATAGASRVACRQASLRALVLLLACAATLAPAGVRAQAEATAAPEPAGYRALIDAALQEYSGQNYAEARALFLRAHDLFPSARTLRGLGMAEFELKNYLDSATRLQEALAAPVRKLEGPLRAETEALLARALSYLGVLTLDLQPAGIQGVRVSVDGEPVQEDAQRMIRLRVGEHRLLVQAAGYQDQTRSVSIKGAALQHLAVTLQPSRVASLPLAQAHADAAPADDKKHASRPIWKNPWLWSGVGALVVGGVVAAVVLSMDRSPKQEEPMQGDIGGVVETARRW